MTRKHPLEIAKSLYGKERFAKARKILSSYVPQTNQEWGNWHLQMGWLDYREKEFGLTEEHKSRAIEFGEAGAWGLEATLAAFVKKDLARLNVALRHLPDNDLDAINTIIIMARQPGSKFTKEEIFKRASMAVGVTVKDANILHNAARFFIDLGTVKDDFENAIILIEMATAIYDKLKINHHRGAIWYWKSIALLKMHSPDILKAANESLNFWKAARDKNPQIKDYEDRVAGAKIWLAAVEALFGKCPGCGGKEFIVLNNIACEIPGVGMATGKWQKCKECGTAFTNFMETLPVLIGGEAETAKT